nr:MAG: NYN domain-containing protein [Candidatus Kentron sp. MB]VFK76205.1 MAG: NYN domain-containing protein [Candidatus Kentron sp. MB]
MRQCAKVHWPPLGMRSLGVIFLVDGFNLYHSLIQAQKDAPKDTKGATAKWLDLKGLCSSFLPSIGRISGRRATLEHIYYFSALPTHRDQSKQNRHALYVRCLEATGITVELGRFKSKRIWCGKCKKCFTAHEEKETDVAIATRLFEILHLDQAETLVLITGDTDLAPAVRTCKRLFPKKGILFAFPYRRENTELSKISPESFTL